MNVASSPSNETGTVEVRQAASVSALSDRRWRSPSPRASHYALLRRMLACADVTAALLASFSLVFVGEWGAGQLAWSLVYLPVWLVVAKVLGLYDRDGRIVRHVTVDEIPQLVLWGVLGTSGLSLVLALSPVMRPESSSAVVAGVVAVVAVVALRAIARRSWRSFTPLERTAVVGDAGGTAAFRRKLELFPELHMTVVDQRGSLAELDEQPLATIDRLVFAPEVLREDEVREVLRACRTRGIALSLIPPCRTAFSSSFRLHHVAELPLLEYTAPDLSRSTVFLKRVLDVSAAAAGLVVLSPVLVTIAFAIKVDTRGPALFSQLRAGQGGRPFRMRKFRTMVEDAEELLPGLVAFDDLAEPVFKLRNDPRVTRAGRTLRRWSLDELPQLWNVLRGDMSLVGPRPEQVELVDRYSPEQRFRLQVKPGMTGPMQVYGRGRLTLAERLAVERDYIENLSIGRDLRTIGMTVAVVLGRKGAY